MYRLEFHNLSGVEGVWRNANMMYPEIRGQKLQ